MLPTLVYTLLFILPFVFFPNLPDPFELPKAVVLLFTVVFTISLYKLAIITDKKHNVNTPIIQKLILVYLAIQLIGSLTGVNFGKSLWGQYFRYQGLATQLAYFGLFYLILKGGTYGLKREKLFAVIGYSGILVALLTIFQGIAYFLLRLPVYTFMGRMTATLGNPNFAGGFLALSFILALNYAIKSSSKLDYYKKTALVALFLSAIVLTQSRGALFAFSFAFVATWYPKQFSLKRIAVIMLLALSVLILYPKREISSFDNRFFIWQKAIEAVLKRPFFGWGLENFEQALASTLTYEKFDLDLRNIRIDKAHNETLEIAVSSGIIGLFVWFAIVAKAATSLWKKREEKWAQTTLLLLFTFLFLAQINVVNINQYLFFYLSLALSAEKNNKL